MAERPFDMRGNRHLIIYGTADRPMVPTQSAPAEPVDEAAVAATPKCMEVRKFTWITPNSFVRRGSKHHTETEGNNAKCLGKSMHCCSLSIPLLTLLTGPRTRPSAWPKCLSYRADRMIVQAERLEVFKRWT